MALLGAAVVVAARGYDLGSLTQMGPGMFPYILGWGLILVGLLIGLAALASPCGTEETAPPWEWRGWACILAGPILFILMGDHFGLAPAIFACVFVSALGDRTTTLKNAAILAACVTVLGGLTFFYLLQMPFPLFRLGLS